VPGPTPLGVAASVAAYRDGGPWLADLLSYLEANRDLVGDVLASDLPELTWSPPEGTYLAWIDCAGLGVDDPATFFLDHARVAVNDGPPFGLGAEQHVRLNFATSRALLERILDAMSTAVRGIHPRRHTPPR
jgi:cystathionine beta-lyase